MPPGTGDVPLTVFQSLPVDGIVIVSSPQDLVQMVVGKAVNMANMMQVPVLGIVENMAYVECPQCGEKIYPFGPSRLEETAAAFEIEALGQLPIDPKIAAACDAGTFEDELPRRHALRGGGHRHAHGRVRGRAARAGRVAWHAGREEPRGRRRARRRSRPRRA